MLQPKVEDALMQSTEFIFVPTTEQEYDRLVAVLDEITDTVRDDEAHPLAKTMDVISVLIEAYEDKHVPEPQGDAITVLKHFMEAYQLKQSDLSEIGSQGVVSEILSGKRELNVRQIRELGKRFNIPASVFV